MKANDSHPRPLPEPAALRAEILRLLDLATVLDLRLLYFYLQNLER